MMRRSAFSLAALLALASPAWAAETPRAPDQAPPAPVQDQSSTDSQDAPIAHPVPPGAPPGSATVRLNGQAGFYGGIAGGPSLRTR